MSAVKLKERDCLHRRMFCAYLLVSKIVLRHGLSTTTFPTDGCRAVWVCHWQQGLVWSSSYPSCGSRFVCQRALISMSLFLGPVISAWWGFEEWCASSGNVWIWNYLDISKTQEHLFFAFFLRSCISCVHQASSFSGIAFVWIVPRKLTWNVQLNEKRWITHLWK